MTTTITISSLDGFIKETLNSSQKPLGYRGVTDSHYQLIPGIGRIKKGTSKAAALKKEYDMFFEFKRHIAASHGILSNLSTAILAQHYGLPTRLLDWTASPLTALFFACGGDSNKDAAVYILPNSLKKLNFKEQIYDLILLGQDKEFTDIFKKELKITFINNNTIYEYLEKYLERLSRNEDNGMVIYPYVNNKRIQSQDSFFTLHVDPFKGINKKETNEIIIPANQKKKIRRELTLLGTHEYSIFPDEDGLCKWLKRKHYSDIME